MLAGIFKFLGSRLGQVFLAFFIGIGVGLVGHKVPPGKIVHVVDPNNTVVTIEKPVLTTKEVLKVIQDPAQSQALKKSLDEAKSLGVQLTEAKSTLAELKSHGSGEAVVVPPVGPGPVEGPKSYEFKDFQLDARYTGPKFEYDLHQQFIVESVSGRTKDGSPYSSTHLYQLMGNSRPPDNLIPIPASTTSVISDNAVNRWLVSPRIQAGLGVGLPTTKSGIVTIQWLKKGKSNDPKEIKVGVLNLGLAISKDGVTPILEPVSFNLGSLPRQPFSNIWIGPTIDLNKHVGVALTATF